MFIYAIWFSTLGLFIVLICVAIWRRFISNYWAFYLYLTLLLVVGVLRYYVLATDQNAYLWVYWWTKFLAVSAGFCVIWEIFNQTLAHYPGVLRVARFLVSSTFVIAVSNASVGAMNGRTLDFVRSVVRLERNMLALQGVLLVLLAVLIVYYGIPLGRNSKGLLCGYCLYLGTSVILLTMQSALGPAIQPRVDQLRQASYLVAVFIWVATFWRYEPNPVPAAANDLEQDYAILAEQTANMMAKARAHLLRVFTS